MVLEWIIRKLDVARGQDLYAKGRVQWELMLTLMSHWIKDRTVLEQLSDVSLSPVG
jgi:hypothetical protein